MSLFRSPTLALAVAILGIAAVLGGSLGLATAGTTTVSPGFNLKAGPLFSDVTPDKYVECLPDASWRAVYIWKGDQQEWRHFFNTETADNVPAFVNHTAVGGMEVVPQFAGVVILMSGDIEDNLPVFFPDRPDEDCPS